MSNKNTKSEAEIISDLQKENQQLKQRVRQLESGDLDFLAKARKPTGPLQTQAPEETAKRPKPNQ